MINYAAVYISTKRDRVRRFFTGLLPLLVILGVKFGLIMLEPDFGTAAALAFAALVVIFAGGAHLGQLVLLGALAAPVVWQLVVKEEYRFRRLTRVLESVGGSHWCWLEHHSVAAGHRLRRLVRFRSRPQPSEVLIPAGTSY